VMQEMQGDGGDCGSTTGTAGLPCEQCRAARVQLLLMHTRRNFKWAVQMLLPSQAAAASCVIVCSQQLLQWSGSDSLGDDRWLRPGVNGWHIRHQGLWLPLIT
jgi:hypothetical protein